MTSIRKLLEKDENGLLPCVVCNGTAEPSKNIIVVRCADVGCSNHYESLTVHSWNTRAYIEPLRQAIECIEKMREALSEREPIESDYDPYMYDIAFGKWNKNREEAIKLADEILGDKK